MIPRENSLFTALGNTILPPFTKKEYFKNSAAICSSVQGIFRHINSKDIPMRR